MENYMYEPGIIDATHIQLCEEKIALGEKLAKNTHVVWSIGRSAEGWVCGRQGKQQGRA
jgi:hypothetical protein